MYIAAAAALAGFCVFFRSREKLASPPEFGLATKGSARIALPVAAVIALMMAAGSVMLLVPAGGEAFPTLLRVLALMGVFCAAGFMGMPARTAILRPGAARLSSGSAWPAPCRSSSAASGSS